MLFRSHMISYNHHQETSTLTNRTSSFSLPSSVLRPPSSVLRPPSNVRASNATSITRVSYGSKPTFNSTFPSDTVRYALAVNMSHIANVSQSKVGELCISARVLRVVFSLTVSVFVLGADSSTSNPRIVRRGVFSHHYQASSLSAVDQQKCFLLAAAECQDRTDDLRIMRPTL